MRVRSAFFRIRVRGERALAVAALSLGVALLADCGKPERPMTTVMQFVESAYRDLEEARAAIDAGGAAPEAAFAKAADRARRIVALSDEPQYAAYRSEPFFQRQRAALKERAATLADAAARGDAAAVRREFEGMTETLYDCHREYPVNPRQIQRPRR